MRKRFPVLLAVLAVFVAALAAGPLPARAEKAATIEKNSRDALALLKQKYGENAAQLVQNFGLRLGVDAGQAVIQDEHRRMKQKSQGGTHFLAHTSGERVHWLIKYLF